MLMQSADNVICDSNVQRAAAFIGEDVYPVVVIAHASRNDQRCFASLNMTNVAALKSQRKFFGIFDALLHFDEESDGFFAINGTMIITQR